MTTQDILNHMTAGRAIFTLQSTSTRYTYRIKKDKQNDNRFFCQVMFGNENDNDRDYRFIGWFYKDSLELRHSDKCKITKDDLRFRYLDRLLFLCKTAHNIVNVNYLPSTHCARCGRLLTTPESIEAGLGPECAKYNL